SPYESIARLHMRYYNFVFPLLVILAASQIGAAEERVSSWLRIAIALLIAVIVGYAAMTNFRAFTPSFVDSPELRGLTANHEIMLLVGAASIICLVIWIVSARVAASVFLFVILPVCAVVESYYVAKDVRPHLAPDAYDNAGLFARRFLSVAERD